MRMSSDTLKVGFIGGGNMAYAIAKGIVNGGVLKADHIMTSAKTETRLNTIWKVLNIFHFIFYHPSIST